MLLVALALLVAPTAALSQDDGDEAPAEDPPPTEETAAEEPAAAEDAAEGETAPEEAPAEEPPPAADSAVEETPTEEAAAEETPAEEEPEIEPFVPGIGVPEEDTVPYDDQLEEEDPHVDDGKPFAKGDIELGLGLGGFGSSEYFVLSVGGSFAYYVVNRLAPGIDINYMHVFSDDYEYPDSFTLLPFLKFVIIRSAKFAPYLIAAGGREFQWGGSTNPIKGIREADAWILGGGAGAHIGLGEHFALKLQLLALYYWYDDQKVIGVKDSEFGEDGTATIESGGKTYLVDESDDGNDLDGELFFPLITIGFAVFF